MMIMSTKTQLLRSLDDFEALSKELIEVVTSPNRANKAQNIKLIIDAMIYLDNNAKNLRKKAEEQLEVNHKVLALQAEISHLDRLTTQLQKQLSEAEQLLATAVYQAKQKLESITKANKKPVSSEELVKLAHRISASNGVCAPLTWQQGDLRRPYPTDVEMRLGMLSRMGDFSGGNQNAGVTDFMRSNSSIEAGTYSWFSSASSVVGGSSSVMQRLEEGDSSDSSSSSDSDSP